MGYETSTRSHMSVFASVYRDFQDEQAFFNELKSLMRQKLN